MTGFGRADQIIGSYQFSVEARSVNHRYLDLRFRLPPALQVYESAFSEMVRAKIQRGSIDLAIRQKLAGSEKAVEGSVRFTVDTRAAESFVEACQQLRAKFGTSDKPSLELLHATGRVFLAIDDASEAGPLPPALKALVEQALGNLVSERNREGAQTRASLEGTVQQLQTLAQQWKAVAATHPEKIREKLTKRVEQWKVTPPADTQRMELEIAFLADRADISEEIQRFEAHLEEFSKLLQSKGGVGRKLDFLTQELHRETNTVASKADDLSLSRLAVEAKTAIEKLREQVQNVE